MTLFRFTIILFSVLASASLWSCHEQSTALSQPDKAVVVAKEAKPGAAVKLMSRSIVFINANEPTQIELLLNVVESVGTLNLEFSTTNGLEVLDSPLFQRITLTSLKSIKVPVKLRALTNGRYYLHIHAGIDNGDSLSVRNLALIVQVGAETEKTIQLKKSSGENVLILPAQETISNE
jgi:hypothetical protein